MGRSNSSRKRHPHLEQQEVILLIVGFNMAKDTIKITTKVAKTSHLQEGGARRL